jgi:hypothetical protein
LLGFPPQKMISESAGIVSDIFFKSVCINVAGGKLRTS